ncbi:hypothetical protein [Halomonas sp. KHS3]|uniref:hypothetical protein n=1 Tax=Halomonas sp. KHS3 TaxID=866350 RepID=UPI00059B1E94|nr:hypothetical protein [Halomonas sp. KHS3]KIN14476.1 hypothetical protein RO22_13675 [Halomonas sp. KHS3]
MKWFILLLLALFLFSAIAGYQTGKDYLSQNNVVHRHAFGNITHKVIEDKVYLVKEIDGSDSYIYDVNTNELSVASLEILLSTLDRKDKSPLSLDGKIFSGIVGGATLGFSVKDVLTNPRAALQRARGDWRRMLIAMSVMASGYGLGFWVATKDLPNINSQRVSTILEDRENWIKQEYIEYLLLVKTGVKRLKFLIENSSEKKIYEQRLEELTGASLEMEILKHREKADLKSDHFIAAYSILAESSNEYDKLKEYNDSFVERWGAYFMWGFLALGMCILAGFFLQEKFRENRGR